MSYSFTALALDGMSGQRHAPTALNARGNDPLYPLDRKLSGSQSRSGLDTEAKGKSICLRRNRTSTVDILWLNDNKLSLIDNYIVDCLGREQSIVRCVPLPAHYGETRTDYEI
jgi:hypothetical protein